MRYLTLVLTAVVWHAAGWESEAQKETLYETNSLRGLRSAQSQIDFAHMWRSWCFLSKYPMVLLKPWRWRWVKAAKEENILHMWICDCASKAENWTVVYAACHQKTRQCLNQSPAGWKCSCLQTQCTPEATHESMGWSMPGCGIGPRGWPASTHKLDPWQGCYTAFVFRGCAPLTVHPTLKSLFGSMKISSHRVCFAFILMWTPELLWLRFGAVWDECKGLLRFSISTVVWRERRKNDK